jgi:hypothetical protein
MSTVNPELRKISILHKLEEFGSKIRHQHQLVEYFHERGDGDSLAKANDLIKSLKKLIPEYIDVAIVGLKSKRIAYDPFAILYDEGFSAGSIGAKIASNYLNEVMVNDEEGFLASVQLHRAKEQKQDTIVMLKDKIALYYHGATDRVALVKNGVITWFKAIKGSVIEFWNWIKAKLEQARNYVGLKFTDAKKNWFAPKQVNISNLQATATTA